MRTGWMEPYVERYHYGLTRIDGTWQIRYRKAVLDLEASQAHGAVTVCLASDEAEMTTGVRIAQPGTTNRWRREADAVLHLR